MEAKAATLAAQRLSERDTAAPLLLELGPNRGERHGSALFKPRRLSSLGARERPAGVLLRGSRVLGEEPALCAPADAGSR
jgi:hypothetical protein